MNTSSMKISKIILYNNGLQAFERTLEVEGSTSADLFFKVNDMPEVLKSLKLIATKVGDDQGHNVGLQTCSYESLEESRTFASSIRVPEDNSVTEMIKNLKGNRVAVTVASEKIEGIVLGIEHLRGKDGYDRPFINLLLGTGTFRAIDILELSDISIVDPNVRKDLQYALEIYLNEKKKEMKRLTIYSQGKEKRIVTARYSLQADEWKTSYRVQLDRKSNKATLEVYAIIDNTQNEDWENVQMTLVTGAPPIKSNSSSSASGSSSSSGSLSLTVKTLSGGTLTINANGNDTVDELKRKIFSRDSSIAPANQRLVFAGKQMEDGRTLADYNIQSGSTINVVLKAGVVGTSGGESKKQFRMAEQGSLSYYVLDYPITVKRNQSALIPILRADLQTQHVSLFNPDLHGGNPLSAVLFENSTNYTLEKGPVAFNEGAVFLGESELLQMKPKDETLLAYALDSNVEVAVDRDISKLPCKRVVVEKGDIKFFNDRRQRTIYTFYNKPKKTMNLFLDHVFLDGWKLVESDPPVDITDRYYRFNITIPADEKFVFNVREKTTDMDSVWILDAAYEDIDKWLETNKITKEVYSQIISAKDTRKQATHLATVIYEKENEIRDVKDTQERLRKNITALADNSSEQKKYVQELSKEEDKLNALYASIKKDRQNKKDLELEADLKIKKISYSVVLIKDQD